MAGTAQRRGLWFVCWGPLLWELVFQVVSLMVGCQSWLLLAPVPMPSGPHALQFLKHAGVLGSLVFLVTHLCLLHLVSGGDHALGLHYLS